MPESKQTRRHFFQWAASLAAGASLVGCRTLNSAEQTGGNQLLPHQRRFEGTIRDRFWVWTHQAGSHDKFGIPKPSRMTPMEGAAYLDVPNAMFITFGGQPKGDLFDPYAISLRPLKRVGWSLTGEAGHTSVEAREAALALAGRHSNIDRFVLDDFFQGGGSNAVLSADDLRALRDKLVINGQRRTLWVVVYEHLLHLPIGDHLQQCDGVTYWTWAPRNLQHLETNMAKLEEISPKTRKMLGCYFWDYQAGKPLPLELMQQQCEIGLKWLHEGRIEGMIFLGSNVCDIELDTVEWTREWIAKVGDQRVKHG